MIMEGLRSGMLGKEGLTANKGENDGSKES